MALGNAVNAQTTGFQSLNSTTGVWNGRTLTPGTGITITNQDGTGGNPVISATGSFNPSSTIMLVEDFVADPTHLLTDSNSITSVVTTESGHPGIYSTNSLGAGNFAGFTLAGLGQFVLGGGALSVDIIFNITALSVANPRYTLRLGMTDQTTAAEGSNGCYFVYSDNINSGNWQIINNLGGSKTTGNSTLAVTTGWHHATVSINAAATSVSYVMDGVTLNVSPLTTNIPTAAVFPSLAITREAGTVAVNTLYIDLMYLNQTLTVTR